VSAAASEEPLAQVTTPAFALSIWLSGVVPFWGVRGLFPATRTDDT
jgi:hypothetical protein